MNDKLSESACASLKNGRRLLDDAECLEFSEAPTTAYFLSLIAQGEFAKAFLLALGRGIILGTDDCCRPRETMRASSSSA